MAPTDTACAWLVCHSQEMFIRSLSMMEHSQNGSVILLKIMTSIYFRYLYRVLKYDVTSGSTQFMLLFYDATHSKGLIGDRDFSNMTSFMGSQRLQCNTHISTQLCLRRKPRTFYCSPLLLDLSLFRDDIFKQ